MTFVAFSKACQEGVFEVVAAGEDRQSGRLGHGEDVVIFVEDGE